MKYIILLLAAVVVVQAQTNKGESFATNATYNLYTSWSQD